MTGEPVTLILKKVREELKMFDKLKNVDYDKYGNQKKQVQEDWEIPLVILS
jgi:hypothetical protein